MKEVKRPRMNGCLSDSEDDAVEFHVVPTAEGAEHAAALDRPTSGQLQYGVWCRTDRTRRPFESLPVHVSDRSSSRSASTKHSTGAQATPAPT